MTNETAGGIRRLSGRLMRWTPKTVEVTSAQVLTLNATPVTIIPAAGAGQIILPRFVAIRHNGGTAYAGIDAGENLVLKYTNASGSQCSTVIASAGFLDQTTAQIRMANGTADSGATAGGMTPVANSPIVLHLLTGEITTGNFPLRVKVWYDIIESGF
jgi:hypothetical protein